MRAFLALALIAAPAAAQAAPLTPNHGAVAYSGTLADSGGRTGRFEVTATLKAGDFSGRGRAVFDNHVIEGPLVRGYLENGRCVFRVESGRDRVEFSGKCDTDRFEGRFDSFHPGDARVGTLVGTGRAAKGPAAAASAIVPLPTAKLTCAYQDRKIGVAMGEATQYSLAFSNMGSLTLSPAGTYSAGTSAKGKFVRTGNKVKLVSGPWAGAVGTVERDRSGQPAVVFHIEENRRTDGVHRVDPYTTRCTRAR